WAAAVAWGDRGGGAGGDRCDSSGLEWAARRGPARPALLAGRARYRTSSSSSDLNLARLDGAKNAPCGGRAGRRLVGVDSLLPALLTRGRGAGPFRRWGSSGRAGCPPRGQGAQKPPGG